MPKIIQTVFDVTPEEAILVRSAYLRNDIKASALVAEARRRVADMTVQSENNAERLYHEAKAEGYAAGILEAAEALTQYLASHAELAEKLQKQLQQKISFLLQRCMNDADVLMAVFEECLAGEDFGITPSLDVLLPEKLRINHRRLMERLQQHVDGQVNIQYRQDSRFLLRLGDHVAEFAPDDFVALATARVINNLPSIYAQYITIAERCRERLAMLGDFMTQSLTFSASTLPPVQETDQAQATEQLSSIDQQFSSADNVQPYQSIRTHTVALSQMARMLKDEGGESTAVYDTLKKGIGFSVVSNGILDSFVAKMMERPEEMDPW
eukprot:gene23166-24534_t